MMDDEFRLVRAMARRDRTAWGVMYERHVRAVFGLVYYLLGADRGDAEEVCQEAWLIAIERFDSFDPRRGKFRDWLLGIARHRALRRSRRTTGSILDDRPDGPSEALAPLELLEQVKRRPPGSAPRNTWARTRNRYSPGTSDRRAAPGLYRRTLWPG